MFYKMNKMSLNALNVATVSYRK